MGFYGNISNIAKTTFTFDRVYSNRLDMDQNVNTDGIFLGRYVLVDYGEQPIKGYFLLDPNDPNGGGYFYNSHITRPEYKIIGNTALIYQDLNNVQSGTSFYYYDSYNKKFYPRPPATISTYQINFQIDVNEYGRGYDSTVWTKRYKEDGTSEYVSIAELNAVVPNMHLVVDQPQEVPITPYFDRDTTNIDYYLHMQSNFGTRIGKITEGMHSDEQAPHTVVNWTVDQKGPSYKEVTQENADVDIYYNNAGFDHTKHNFSEDKVEVQHSHDNQEKYDKKEFIDYSKNAIGYRMTKSGRLYGNEADQGVYSNGIPAEDIQDWYIRLPGIGNAICRMWDKVYGYISPKEDDTEARKLLHNSRHLNDALTYNDTESNLVTYDRTTLMGVMNTAQDLIGYHFISFEDYNPPKTISGESSLITINLKYDNLEEKNQSQTKTYDILKCIFYDANKEYYAYHYYPEYASAEVDPDTGNIIFESDKTYYYLEDDIYHIANLNTYKATDADGKTIPSKTEYFYVIPQWKLEKIGTIADNSIQTLIAQIHTMLGTNIGEIRDITSIQGAINIMKDVIANIDTNLMPGRLLHTDDDGVIKTCDTYFPSATWDRDEVLNGNGDWVSRFATIKVLKNSTNDNQKTFKVNDATSGKEAGADIVTIISDNNKDENGNSPTNPQELHSPNNLTFGTRNKWIQLHADDQDDSIEFRHLESPIIGRLRAEQAIGTTDDSLPIYVNKNTTDDNDNVILKTKDELIAENADFDSFSVNDNATEITVKPTTDNLEYKSDVSDQNDNRLTIPYLTVDNAGHVVELGTKNFNIPHGFKKIETTAIEVTDESNSSDKPGISIAESISDTLELAPKNRWINIATEVDNNKEGSAEDNSAEDPKADKITFGHKLVPTLKENVTLNGERRTQKTEIETVYRFGLPQNKIYGENGNLDKQNENEAANTFNVPYIEVDMAGHVVAAETHTVEIPHTYNKISTGTVIDDTAVAGTAGSTIKDEAAVVSMKAETLEEEIVYAPFNKWIRINAITGEGKDTVRFGHEIHTIVENEPSTEDLDSSAPEDKTFTTKVVNWDDAGHIIEHGTTTWTLPNSIRNINIISTSNSEEVSGTIEAGVTSDTITVKPSNQWIEIGKEEDKQLTFGHSTSNVGTSQEFINLNNESSFVTQELTYDDAGHIIGHATKTWTMPHVYQTISIGDTKLSAKNTHDELVYAGNEWINLEGKTTDNGTKEVIFKHSKQEAISIDKSSDVYLQNGQAYQLSQVNYDDAGHITSVTQSTYHLPKHIEKDNDWITVTEQVNGEQHQVVYSHKSQQQMPEQSGLYKITIDQCGHISAAEKATPEDIGLDIKNIISEITSRFSLILNAPEFSLTQEKIGENIAIKVEIENKDQASTYNVTWGQEDVKYDEVLQKYIIQNASAGNEYTCTVERIYADVKSQTSKSIIITEETEEGTV